MMRYFLFGLGAVGTLGIRAVARYYRNARYSRADIWCLFVHRWLLRTWTPGFAALGIGFGPRDECMRCERQWGIAWAGEILA